MKWLQRTLWLAAWSLWAWLGFGLGRELPRDPGRPLHALRHNEWFCGRLDDGATVTRLDGEDGREPCCYQISDAVTGDLLHEWKGPPRDYRRWESIRLGVVAGVNTEAAEAGAAEPFQLLDLRTGAWTALGSPLLHVECEHPTRPWLLIDDGAAPLSRLRVYDVHARRWIFDWVQPVAPQTQDEEVSRAWFDGDELVIVIEQRRRWGPNRRPYPYPESQRLERWDVLTQSRVASAPIEPPARFIEPWPNGRMLLLGRSSLPESAAIVELRSLQTVFQATDLDEGEPAWLEIPARVVVPRPSASGRTLLSRLGRLWSIAQGRVLWRASVTERVEPGDCFATTFCTRESWTPRLTALHLPFSLTTFAVRDLESGRLQYRTFSPGPSQESISDRAANGLPPPPPNRPLLAFCQTILALPPILLWTFLRSRHNRRLQLAGPTA